MDTRKIIFNYSLFSGGLIIVLQFYEKTSCDLALEHFDTFYRPMFGDLWPTIRISLLTTKKMCAVLNSYTSTEHVNSEMRGLGAYNILNDAAAEQARAMERLNSDLGDVVGVTGTIQPLSQAK